MSVPEVAGKKAQMAGASPATTLNNWFNMSGNVL
jgi:hypothetical protein